MSENFSDGKWGQLMKDFNDFYYYDKQEVEWRNKARENLDKWGLQSFKELLLAMQEELGELTKAYLKHDYEDGDFESITEELDDLMALGYQLRFKIEEDSD